jgi:hypothetical protein
MLYKVGRILQFLGLVILPVAIAGEVAHSLSLQESIALSVVGATVFTLGWFLQQGSKPK